MHFHVKREELAAAPSARLLSLARSLALPYITKSLTLTTSLVTRLSTGVSDTRLGTHVSTRTAETRVLRTVGAAPPSGPTGVREPPVDLPVHPEQRASQTTPAEDQRSERQTHLTSLCRLIFILATAVYPRKSLALHLHSPLPEYDIRIKLSSFTSC